MSNQIPTFPHDWLARQNMLDEVQRRYQAERQMQRASTHPPKRPLESAYVASGTDTFPAKRRD